MRNSNFPIPQTTSQWKEILIQVPPETGPCRYCKHNTWEHRPDAKGNRACREGMYDTKCIPTDAVYILVPQETTVNCCPCMAYIPGDNLAYLEWKEKRGY